jgi:hypothetical protein
MSDLYHLIYTSAATSEISEDELQKILKSARHNNTTIGITGILLYENGSFLQVLEGSKAAVQAFYNEIARDPRHSDIKILVEEPISKRDFGDWTMGYVGLTREQLQEVEGLNDFYNEGKCYVDMGAGRAKAILTAFLRGRWPDALAG